MSKFNIFEFKFGKEKKSVIEWIKVGAIIHLTLDTVSLIPGVKKKKVFNLLDEFQSFVGIDILNDYIIQDTELVSYRIDRVLNKAIEEYKKNED
jgi:ERCC4-type nuclease